MKKIGIGYENYRDFIDQDLYYVDKTLFIRDILEKGGIVTLLTRPRRFGKSLNLSMLQTFFEMELDEDGNIKDNSRYFTGMKVMECGVDVLSKMGKYPVIKLSLKGAKQPDFSQSFLMLRKEIIDEYSRHSYLKDSTRLDEKERQRFRELWLGENDWSERAKKFTGREEREYALREECGKYAASLKEAYKRSQHDTGRNVEDRIGVRDHTGINDYVPDPVQNAHAVQDLNADEDQGHFPDVEQNIEDTDPLLFRLRADETDNSRRHAVAEINTDDHRINALEREHAGC